ncbi:MAG: glycosyltransferase family 4 protein [Candidatus Pacebacteria bacterium]|nr:glycosyltransferase family 4 protein [Candidatus Paceibacterota bacterium]
MNIGWVQIASRRYGGVVYEETVKKILAENFDLELVNIDSKIFKKGYLRAPEIFFNLLRLEGKKDLWIRDNKTVALAFADRTRGKKLAIVHHIDFSQTPLLFKPMDFLLEKMIYLSLRKMDVIVTVSRFWQDHFFKKGFKDVRRIYNCFDVPQYQNILNEDLTEFRKRYGLEAKPIVYLGPPQKAKGVLESYRALKDLDVHLVTSGERMAELPVKNLQVDFPDYLRLLRSSSFVIAMSKIKEGWGRIAHEAMLLKTPVLGSGRGGMGELLQGGDQIICKDFKELRRKAEFLLDDPSERERLGNLGYEFARKFDSERFKNNWLELVNSLKK